MKVAVVGAGAVGGYFGGTLALGGNEVTFLARGNTLQTLRSGPLRVESPKGEFEVVVRATDNGEEIGPVDLVLVAVKAWQVNEVAASIRPMLGQDSIVVPFQNGVDAPAQLAAALGPNHIAGGLCRIFVSTVAPGHVRHISGEPFVAFGEIYGDLSHSRLEEIRDTFTAVEIRCEIACDVLASMWEKFLFSAPCGSLCALTKLPVGAIRTDAKLRAQLIDAMQEVVDIAHAKQINLTREIVSKTLEIIDSLPAESTSSMQRDIMAGRPSELEAQTGAVVRLGQEVNVPTPIHCSIYQTLRSLECLARSEATEAKLR